MGEHKQNMMVQDNMTQTADFGLACLAERRCNISCDRSRDPRLRKLVVRDQNPIVTLQTPQAQLRDLSACKSLEQLTSSNARVLLDRSSQLLANPSPEPARPKKRVTWKDNSGGELTKTRMIENCLQSRTHPFLRCDVVYHPGRGVGKVTKPLENEVHISFLPSEKIRVYSGAHEL